VPEPEDEPEAVEAPEPLPQPPRIENNRTIELDRFVTANEIDSRYHDTPYYIVPREPIGQEAFAVMREAMREANKAGMGRVVLAKRERPILVEPFGKGLRGMTLRYAHEVREPEEYFAEIPDLTLPRELRDIAEHILRTKAGSFDPAFLEDRYRTVLIEKLGDKKRLTALHKRGTAEASRENVINLMDALKRSLAAEGSTPRKSASQPNASVTHIAAAAVVPKPTRRRAAATVKPVAMKRAGGRGQKTR
jgi:DNA end-binding protein Ku